MRTSLYVLCMVILAAGASSAQEDALRTAWTFRADQRATLLREAEKRLDRLVRRWQVKPQLRPALDKNADAVWMLEHPHAAYLVLDAELAQKPVRARRSVLLHMAGRLRRRELGRYLPPLLSASTSNEERSEVLDCMAVLRHRESLRALDAFLGKHPRYVDESLLVTAVRGLGLSGRTEYLRTINRARKTFESLRGRFEGAKAAWRCGDSGALREVGQFLSCPEADLRAEALDLLREAFCEETLMLLADFAGRTEDQQLACAAVEAIIEATGYGKGSPAEGALLAGEPDPSMFVDPVASPNPAEEPKEPRADAVPPGMPPDISELPAQERQALLDQVLAWWDAEGRELLQKRRTIPDIS